VGRKELCYLDDFIAKLELGVSKKGDMRVARTGKI